jgi:hypothetical protein
MKNVYSDGAPYPRARKWRKELCRACGKILVDESPSDEGVYVTNPEQRKVIFNEGGQLAADRIAELESQLEDVLKAGNALALQVHVSPSCVDASKKALNEWLEVREGVTK